LIDIQKFDSGFGLYSDESNILIKESELSLLEVSRYGGAIYAKKSA
jgi:hypothetical protein